MSSNPTKLDTARIAITIKKFESIGLGQIRADIALADGANGAVTIDPAKGYKIMVNKPVVLEFSINKGAAKLPYAPVGIAFKSDVNASADPLGWATFPVRNIVTVNGDMRLVVQDNASCAEEFKYTLVIQHADRRIGVIDPKIRNIPQVAPK